MATSAFGVVPTAALDIEVAKVMRTVDVGAQFRYVFDLGDDWTHCCTVDAGHADPADVLGVVPPTPMAYWGWGTIPDQYDRGWAEDDGEGSDPPRPRQPHVMRAMGGQEAERDLLWSTSTSCELRRRPATWRLELRGLPGDEELAQDMLAAVRLESPPGQPLHVDLEELSGLLEGDPASNDGGFLGLRTREVISAVMTDKAMVGGDAAIDIEAEPDRWLWVSCEGSRAGWEDMATYVAAVADSHLRERLERAIEGKGAYRRIRDLIGHEGLTQA